MPRTIHIQIAAKFIIALLALIIFGAGCSKPATESGNATQKLEKAFNAADSATRRIVEKAVTEIKSENYEPAVRALENILLAEKQITPEQSQAIRDVLKALPAYPRLAP